MKKLNIILLLYIFYIPAYSQMPSEDPNFEMIFNEEFNGSTINRSTWQVYNSSWWVPRFVDNTSTIDVSGGYLNLTAKYVPTSPYKFETGAIRSRNGFFVGTYFECRSKIPLGINAFPSFWVWEGIDCTLGGDYREIDILEYWNYYSVSSSNLHFCKCSGIDDICRTSIVENYNVPNPNTFHTYAAYWNSKNIIHILDNIPIIQRNNLIGAFTDRTKAMYIENSLQVADTFDINDDPDIIDKRDFTNPADFPMTYQTDYIRAYRLRQNCNVVINDIPDFSTYIYSLKKAIYLSSATTIPISSTQSLRAVDEIELKDGFEVPNNTHLYLNTNECY